IGDVDEALRGSTHGLDQRLVTIAESVHRDATHEVEIPLSLGIEQKHALSTHHLARGALVGVQNGVRTRHLCRRHQSDVGDAFARSNRAWRARANVGGGIDAVSGWWCRHGFSGMNFVKRPTSSVDEEGTAMRIADRGEVTNTNAADTSLPRGERRLDL